MILIALGSNVTGPWGTPTETLRKALEDLAAHEVEILKTSDFLETEAFGVTDQPNFVNAVAEVATTLGPETLLLTLHEIEKRAGRVRLERWGPRTLDLDLIDYHGHIRAENPILPHPGIAERSFVLMPLLEIAPTWLHPVTGRSAANMLLQLNSG
jgi:2-amino-4-hydroxy-6-hydroxymethyldihydropteridine diphosphokinase